MKPEVPLVIETVTPALAKQYLASMVQNRKRKDGLVINYATVMDDEEWVLNGETLKFNAAGQMIDGQHRCEACILANKSFRTYVARGVEDERAFATIDAGAVRTYGDVLSIAGIVDANNVSAAATRIFHFKKGHLTATGISSPKTAQLKKMTKGSQFNDAPMSKLLAKKELLEFVAPLLEPLQRSLKKAHSTHITKFIPVSMGGALHYLFAEKNLEQADQFMEDFGSGALLADNDPVQALRQKLIHHMGHARLQPNVKMILCIMAWNKRRAGEKSKLLRLMDNPIFPKIS